MTFRTSRRSLDVLRPAVALAVLAATASLRSDTPPLIAAAKAGDTARVATLLKSEPAPDARDADGNTALHWAAVQGHDAVVRDLIRGGASVRATNAFGATPLIYAAGSLNSVRALLDAGVDVNAATKWGTSSLAAAARHPESAAVVRLLLEKGADKSFLAVALDSAALAGDATTYRLLLEAGAKPKEAIRAASMGHQAIVEAALDAGADVNLSPGFAGHALNFALYAHHPAIARLLIERGADLTLRSPAGQHQTPPIVWAAYNQQGDASVARLMIEKGADVNLSTALGETALDWARARNNQSLVALLLASGAREGTRSPKGKAIPDRKLPADQDGLRSLIRSSAGRAIGLLHRTSDAFLESSVVRKQECVTCHQQTLPAVAFAWARERGIPVNEPSIARQVQDQNRYWSKDQKIARTYEMIAPQPDTSVVVGYGLSGLSALGYPADALTEAMVWYLAATQCPDGSWPANDFRPPMEDGPIQGAAFGIRALQLYPLAGREAEFGRRIARARDYLVRARPETFNQQLFQLLGLGWAGDSAQALRPFVEAILEKQGDDGGWSQLDGLPPDAWATGEALVALHTAGGVPTTDPVYQRGIRFLLRTQFEDGSWYVRSRAWPFQPHFESGFPHGKDQWISAGGTAWAVMALLLTQPGVEAPRVDWMAVRVPGRKAGDAADPVSPRPAFAGTRTIDFVRDIQPLLDRSCVGCHSGDKPKGRFHLDTSVDLRKGGQSGDPAVVPNNPSTSPMVQFAKGQIEDLEMPPLGRREKYPALSVDEINRVEAWIREGAEWPDGVILHPANQ